MLHLFSSSRGFPYRALPGIYRQSLQEEGACRYPEEPEQLGQALAWEDFSSYIRLDFFPRAGSLYALWQEGSAFVSALRAEPYRDGFLLSGLETAPEHRGKGFAGQLLAAVLDILSEKGISKVYSHVSKGNAPSLAVHKACGFAVFKNGAVYLDGSADGRCYTLLKNFENLPK